MVTDIPDPFVLLSQFWQIPIVQAIWAQIIAWWWIPTPFVLYAILWSIWTDYNFNRWAINSISSVLLEIIPPKDIDKSPRAMERVLLGFHGLHKTVTPTEAFVDGQFVPSFNLEIHGTNKSTRFYVRVWDKFQNLIEAQIYAQYPKAEIRVVPKDEDYTYSVPANIPNDQWELFAVEYGVRNPSYYPITSYIEDDLDKETEEERKIDPIANLVEIFNTLRDDQQIWIQYKCTPEVKWKGPGEERIKEICGGNGTQENSKYIGSGINSAIHGTLAAAVGIESVEEEKKANDRYFLNPSEQDEVSAIDHKISKHGFKTTVRWIYVTPSNIFDKTYVNAMQGAYKQWGSQTYNDFKWGSRSSTKVDNFFRNYRIRYRQRKQALSYRWGEHSAYYSFIANTEELATLWHLPGRNVETPTLRRVEAKKGQAPGDVPLT